MADAGDADVAGKILTQIEYYFSDSNLPRDKFLKAETAKNAEKWVSISVLLTFNRLKALTTDEAVIAAAMKSSELVQVSEDGKQVRRSPEKPLLDENVITERSIYAKGWPLEGTSIDTVTTLLEGKGCTVRGVRLRRMHASKDFKGSVFAELKDADEARKVVADGIEIDDNKYLVEMKAAYFARKKAERIAKKKASRDEARGKRERDGEGEGDGDANGADETPAEFEEGCVIHIDGIGPGTQREDLKEVFGVFGDISWVDFSRDDVEGYVRFSEAGKGKEACEKFGETKIKDVAPKVRALEGDEEKKFWIQTQKEKMRVRALKSKKRRENSGGRRGGGYHKKYRGKRKAGGEHSGGGKRSRDD